MTVSEACLYVAADLKMSIVLHLGGSVGFNPTDYSALEGSGSVTVTVELSVATEIDIVVELVTSAGTAASGKQLAVVKL